MGSIADSKPYMFVIKKSLIIQICQNIKMNGHFCRGKTPRLDDTVTFLA
jgi:hypothetical protein